MIQIPLLDELREIRRRLSEQCEGDVPRYVEMLREVSQRIPGTYVTKPLVPETAIASPPLGSATGAASPDAGIETGRS